MTRPRKLRGERLEVWLQAMCSALAGTARVNWTRFGLSDLVPRAAAIADAALDEYDRRRDRRVERRRS